MFPVCACYNIRRNDAEVAADGQVVASDCAGGAVFCFFGKFIQRTLRGRSFLRMIADYRALVDNIFRRLHHAVGGQQ